MEGVTVVDHPLVQHKLTLLRDKTRSTKPFRELVDEIAMLLCYEVTRDLPLQMTEIETPLAVMKSPLLAGKKLVFAPILRAGLGLLDGMLALVPSARVAHIGIYRDPKTFAAVEYYFKAPEDVAERLVLVLDPMLATANSAIAAILTGSKSAASHSCGLSACSPRRKDSRSSARITRMCKSGQLRSTTISTTTPISCRA
jgi:uracil phosphoribosyltransferase